MKIRDKNTKPTTAIKCASRCGSVIAKAAKNQNNELRRLRVKSSSLEVDQFPA